MSKDKSLPSAPRASRRGFLTAAGGLAATALASQARAGAGNPANQPPNVPEWTRTLGEGVAVRPYGKPSKFEKDVIRRDVEWLTASRESSVSFTPLHELEGIITPNGLCFERHHGGVADVDPADHRLMIHGLVERPLLLTLDELKRYPRVNRIHFMECADQFRHGVARCPAQRVPVHAWHDPLRAIHRRLAAYAAGGGWRQDQWQMGCWSKAPIPHRWIAACRSRRRSTTASSPTR